MKTRILLCTVLFALCLQTPLAADDWPQWRGPTRDGVWRESGIIEQFDGPQIKLRWSTPISGGYSGPTVADGRVYVTDRVTEPDEMERVHCFRWTDGTKIWTHTYPCDYSKISYRTGPRATVTVDDGRAYSLGSVGHFFCFDAASGEVLWKKDPVDDFRARVPTWGIASHPLVEDDLVILQIGGADGACIVALDKRTGRRRWAALDDKPSYSAPIVIDQAGRRVLVCWTGPRVVGLDAATGELYWQHEVGYTRWVIGIASPVCSADRILIASVDKGLLMLRLRTDEPSVEKVWWRHGPKSERTDGLHSLMCTPYLADGYVYGVNGYGLMRCLNADTGDRLWEDATATSQVRWGTLHMVRNGKNVWMFNDRGELIIGRLSPQGFEEISRAKLIEPTRGQLPKGDGVTWSHPAFAYKHVFIRNDEELVCASLAAEGNAE
jgi:outer membrane protein assembly factor BamB